MCGPGSGNWCRVDTKTTTDDVKNIDIRYFRKHGLLNPGYSGRLTWSRFGRQTGWIRFNVEEDFLVLKYRVRIGAENWQYIEETVRFDRTPCNYGGERKWFKCPECGKRVALLYGAGPRFLCRYCYDLPYGSQQEPYLDRMMRKATKIRERLSAPESLIDPIVFKPKGMHWRTFNKLVKDECNANSEINLVVANKLALINS